MKVAKAIDRPTQTSGLLRFSVFISAIAEWDELISMPVMLFNGIGLNQMSFVRLFRNWNDS